MSSTEYKIVVLGSVVINKPAFIIRFAYGHFIEGNDLSSVDRYSKQCEIDGRQCAIDILDVSAEEEETSPAFLDQYIRTGQGVVLAYSVTSRDSFSIMDELYARILRVRGSSEGVPIVLVGCDCDREGSRQVTTAQGEELARRLGCPFFEVSARDNIRVEEPFIEVVRRINAYSSIELEPEPEPVHERESIKDAIMKRRERKKEERKRKKEEEEEERRRKKEEEKKREEGRQANLERPDVYKVVTLGDSAVGKSAIVVRFVTGHFIFEYDPSIEDSYVKNLEVDGRQYKLNIVDIVGAEDFNSILYGNLKSAHGFMLVYSVTSRDSFEEAKAIYKRVLGTRDSESFPVVLVGSKCDQGVDRQVTTEQGKEFAKELRCPFIETSAKDNIGIEKVFSYIVKEMNIYYPSPDDPERKENRLFKFFGRK